MRKDLACPAPFVLAGLANRVDADIVVDPIAALVLLATLPILLIALW